MAMNLVFCLFVILLFVSIWLFERHYSGATSGAQQPLTDLEFSREYLAGKIFFNVFYRGYEDSWKTATLQFSETEVWVATGLTEHPGDFVQQYEILEGGILKFYIPEDDEYTYIRIFEATEEYLNLCWSDSLEEAQACHMESDEYFFFDRSCAEKFIVGQDQKEQPQALPEAEGQNEEQE